MKFNVAKCHSMRVTRHQHHKQILFDYSLHNQTLENVQSAKYLGITITDNMDWGQHVSEISSKATKTLGFLRRNLAFAPRSTKEVAYKTLVRPKLKWISGRSHRGESTRGGLFPLWLGGFGFGGPPPRNFLNFERFYVRF